MGYSRLTKMQKKKKNFLKDVVYRSIFKTAANNLLLFFYFFSVLTLGLCGLPESLNRLFKIDFV